MEHIHPLSETLKGLLQAETCRDSVVDELLCAQFIQQRKIADAHYLAIEQIERFRTIAHGRRCVWRDVAEGRKDTTQELVSCRAIDLGEIAEAVQ